MFTETIEVSSLLDQVRRRTRVPPPAPELELLKATKPASWVLDAVLYTLRNVGSDLHVGEIARRFNRSPRTLRRAFAVAMYPNPRDVCSAALRLQLEELTYRGIDSPTEQAHRLGFVSTAAMRKAKSRFHRAAKSGRHKRLTEFVLALPRLRTCLKTAD
jgi:transcriptional regulator GlxA family with amidase domain